MNEPPNKIGRPRYKFEDPESLEQIQKLGMIGATYQEIGNWFGCSEKTVQRRMKEEDSPIRAAFDMGSGQGKISLRRMQLQKAQDGDKGMMIWLGKQWLGQADKVIHEGGDKPIGITDTPVDDLELARRVAFILEQGLAASKS